MLRHVLLEALTILLRLLLIDLTSMIMLLKFDGVLDAAAALGSNSRRGRDRTFGLYIVERTEQSAIVVDGLFLTASIETYGHQGKASAWQEIHFCLFNALGMPTLKQRLELKLLEPKWLRRKRH